jgi:hypothetical protein
VLPSDDDAMLTFVTFFFEVVPSFSFVLACYYRQTQSDRTIHTGTMPSCWNLKHVLQIVIAAALTVVGNAFLTPVAPSPSPIPTLTLKRTTSRMTSARRSPIMVVLGMTAEKVQVCSFKDCKRAGGGPRLEKMINEVLEETGLTDAVAVECVDCQGECGYGPNVVVDGKLVNGVRGRDAIMQALGIE